MKRLNLLFIMTFFVSLTVFGQTAQFPTSANVYDLQGKRVNLKDYVKNGKPTLISFWATWCKPCKLELTNMAELYPDWQEKYNLEIVAISTDNARTLPKVRTIVSQKRWDYIILNHPGNELQTTLNFMTIPETFLLDGEGNIIYRHSGYVSGDEYELEEQLEKLLKK